MASTRTWLARIVGFLLVIVLSDAASSWLRISYWTPFANDRALAIYVYQRQRVAADILFLGTSKINAAVIPAVIEDELLERLGRPVTAFCLGQPGTSAFTSWQVLRDVVSSNGSPSVVVLELSPASLNANHGHIPRDLSSYCLLGDLVEATPWINSWERLVAASGGAFRGVTTCTLSSTRAIYWGSVQPRLETFARKHGAQFGPRRRQQQRLSDLSEEQQRQTMRNALPWGRHEYMDRYEIGGAPEAAFRSICRLTRDRGIRLVVLDPPVADRYGRRIATPEESREFRDYLDRAAQTWSFERVELDSAALGLTDADFLNLTHLNWDGAATLSRHLARTVLPGLLAPAATAPAIEESGGGSPALQGGAPPTPGAGVNLRPVAAFL
jgi:hypothetical protein